MLDLSGIIDGSNDVQVFSATDQSWISWQKPRGSRLVHIVCIGAGGGGGGGRSDTAGTDRGGGGGGSGGGVTAGTYLSCMIPDTLFLHVGTGGAGGAAGADGGTGGISFVNVHPSINAEYRICASSTTTANPGAGATGAAGGAGGAAASALTPAGACYLILTNFVSFLGRAGTAGGASSAAGTDANALSGSITSPGSGGGGTDTANTGRNGGIVYTTDDILQNVAGGTASGGAGKHGYSISKPLCFVGGSGGASHGTGTGGAGGDGGIGSGGGGGGAGVTGGAGGRGGNGLIIITSW